MEYDKNVLLIGQAGTGKSKILTELKNHIKDKPIFITSTTGISALNIGGTTLHSFLGIGTGDGTKEYLLSKVNKNYKVKKLLSYKNFVLVIDEVSMLSASLFEKIDYILQKIKGNSLPFGGVQMILSGDFLQLEPIKEKPIYTSELIKHFKVIQLTKNYRQKNDELFQGVLTRLRIAEPTKEDISLLKSLTSFSNTDIKLFSTNKDVNSYNEKFMNNNPNKPYTFKARFTGDYSDLQKQFRSKNIEELVLKKDSIVMLTRNIDIPAGLVNGSIGVIVDFLNNVPMVDFNGVATPVPCAIWEIDIDNKVIASATQIPLAIAYATTIHKCQGLTLDSATIDLKNVFSPHMIYVALSRVKNMKNVCIVNFNEKKIKVNKETIEWLGLQV